MNRVINDFNNIYLHDTPVDNYSFKSNSIELSLKFAHILDEHKDNHRNRAICAKNCKLRFIGIEKSTVRIYNDETTDWDLKENPTSHDLLGDIVENEQVSNVEFKISGMTNKSQWIEWIINCNEVQLDWEVEGDSWIAKNEN